MGDNVTIPRFFVHVRRHKDAEAIEDMLIRKNKPTKGYGMKSTPNTIIYKDAHDLKDKLGLAVAEIEAGNDSEFVKNEARQIVDLMLENGWMSRQKHRNFVSLLE